MSQRVACPLKMLKKRSGEFVLENMCFLLGYF